MHFQEPPRRHAGPISSTQHVPEGLTATGPRGLQGVLLCSVAHVSARAVVGGRPVDEEVSRCLSAGNTGLFEICRVLPL